MRGIVPSLNTPFDEAGELDVKSLERLVNHTVDAGCGGMLGLAVAGEHDTLTLAEKTRYIEIVTRANAGRIPFIVSVTSPDPATSLQLATIATSAGADGLCVQLPGDMSLREGEAFLQDLAQRGPVILMVQDLDWSGSGLPLDDILHLFEAVEKFSWIKIETQQAGPKYSAVLDATKGALNVCGGWAVTQLMDAMACGVHAFIPTGMERVYVAIHDLYRAGDIEAARTLFEHVLPVLNFSNRHIDTSIRFFKRLRKAEGLFETDVCRIPAARFDAIQEREADHALSVALELMRKVDGTPRGT